MSPVPREIEARRLGVGSAVTTMTCGKRPLRLRTKFNASERAFCARSLRITGKRGYAVINQEGRGVDGAVVLSVAHHHDIRCDGVVAAESCRQFGIGLGGPVKRDQVRVLLVSGDFQTVAA
ncbi:hypothetical protein G6F60_014904 [Rhizopus arrhizus]|nr:hypothetical protein G6F60_014904 [Rhizopus arrhizus]